jgi:hypothetical protein
MEFIVKSNQRWSNGSYYQVMSFNDIALFFNCDVDDEVDEMIACVANLNINESHEENFFGGNEYTFKRIK